MARSRGQHRGALVGGQLHGPGQEISVQVRVGRERHPQVPPGGRLAQGPQVTRGVDGQRPPIAQVSQVGGVPQTLIDQRDQMVTGIAHQALQQHRVNMAKILQYSKLYWKSEVSALDHAWPCHIPEPAAGARLLQYSKRYWSDDAGE